MPDDPTDMQSTPKPEKTALLNTRMLFVLAIVLLPIGLYVFFTYSPFAPKDKYGVIGLVDQVQHDLKQIDDTSKDSQWKVQDVELEVNFITKVGADSKANLVAVSNDVSTEHQNTHRLTLKLHREQGGAAPSPPEKKARTVSR
jgi:hypothetical protein